MIDTSDIFERHRKHRPGCSFWGHDMCDCFEQNMAEEIRELRNKLARANERIVSLGYAPLHEEDVPA